MASLAYIPATVIAAMTISVAGGWLHHAYAQTENPQVFPPDSSPYGIPYEHWTAKWWDWFIRTPAVNTPAEDSDGGRCGVNQFNPNVWYVTGNFGGSSVRDCSIPEGRAIMVNIVANECNKNEYPDLKNDDELAECARAGNNPNSVEASFDGAPIQNLERYRFTSPFFETSFPEDNVFGAMPGEARVISDGYFIILRPPPVGTHELHFSQLTLDDPLTGTSGFAYDLNYNITIEPTEFEISENVVMLANQSLPMLINSSSSISNFSFSEEQKTISLKVSEQGPSGFLEIPVGIGLNGPYRVTVDEDAISELQYDVDNATGTAGLNMAIPTGDHDIAIIGTSVVPEFSTVTFIVLALSVSAVLSFGLFARRRSFLK